MDPEGGRRGWDGPCVGQEGVLPIPGAHQTEVSDWSTGTCAVRLFCVTPFGSARRSSRRDPTPSGLERLRVEGDGRPRDVAGHLRAQRAGSTGRPLRDDRGTRGEGRLDRNGNAETGRKRQNVVE